MEVTGPSDGCSPRKPLLHRDGLRTLESIFSASRPLARNGRVRENRGIVFLPLPRGREDCKVLPPISDSRGTPYAVADGRAGVISASRVYITTLLRGSRLKNSELLPVHPQITPPRPVHLDDNSDMPDLY